MTSEERVVAFRDGLLTFGEDMEFEALYEKADGSSRWMHMKPGYVDRDHFRVKASAMLGNYVEYDMVKEGVRSMSLSRIMDVTILGRSFTVDDIIGLA